MGSESCVSIGHGRHKALPGEGAGRVWSPEIGQSWVPTHSEHAQGHTVDAALQGGNGAGRVGDLWHARKHWVQNPGGPASGLVKSCQARTVNSRGTTVMGRAQGVGQLHRTEEASPKGRSEGAAEKGEGRELAKGNVAEQTRRRTQCRSLLSHAPSRVRTVSTFGCLRVIIRGRSPVQSCRTPGSACGVPGNRHPYRNLLVERAANGFRATIQDMGINHGGLHVLMPEQFLHGPNIVSGFKQMRGK